MRIGSYLFSPRLWPTLTTVLVIPGLLALGFWQLDRARQKEDILSAYAERGKDSVVRIDRRPGDLRSFRYQPAIVRGQFQSEHQFFLDNRVMHGRVGFYVLSPLRVDNQAFGILVNRGWVPMGASRQTLPEIKVGTELREVNGLIDVPPEKVFSLGEGEDRDPGWPKILQRIRPELQSQQLGYELLPIVLLMDPSDPDGFVREWKPAFLGPEKHLGYAFQWFSLAVALFIIYITVNTQRTGPGHSSQDKENE